MSKIKVDLKIFEYISKYPHDLMETSSENPAAPPERAPDAANAPKTIFVIEDESIVRRVVVHKLTQGGYHVIYSEGGADALVQLAQYQGPVDLILADVIMPGMNGLDTIREIRKTRPSIPVLYMSGYPADIIASRGMLASDVAFIEKIEITGDGLLKKVCAMLNP